MGGGQVSERVPMTDYSLRDLFLSVTEPSIHESKLGSRVGEFPTFSLLYEVFN